MRERLSRVTADAAWGHRFGDHLSFTDTEFLVDCPANGYGAMVAHFCGDGTKHPDIPMEIFEIPFSTNAVLLLNMSGPVVP